MKEKLIAKPTSVLKKLKAIRGKRLKDKKKREDRTEFLKVSVYVDTGKVVGLISLGVVASALLMTALTLFVR